MTPAALVRRKVLVADDDAEFRNELCQLLEADFDVRAEARGENVLDAVRRQRTEVVLLDIDMGRGMSGLDVLELLQGLDDPPRVIMLTGEERVDVIVQTVRAGAADYVCKPPNVVDLRHRIERCLDELTLLRKTRLLAGQIDAVCGELVVEDPASQQIMQQIGKVAPTDATVLITGQSGTGKEMVAREIHQRSRRSDELFLPVNCTAISASLVEAELFGHEKGAFTGAESTKPGKFELADGGTLFLDEIGDSPPELQQKLLRVLESGRFMRVGGTRELTTSVRLVAATNQDLEQRVQAGQFREDLYHRLNVYRVHLVPLRERPADIMALAERFLERFAAEQAKPLGGFSEQAVSFLRTASWPGNVRDLRNSIERAVINCEGDRISLSDLAVGSAGSRFASLPRDEAKKQAEREFYVSYLSTQLALAGGSVKTAAERSGILPQSFSRLCKEYGVR